MAYAFVNEAGLDAAGGATSIAVSLSCTAGNLIVIGATGDSADSSAFAATPITDGGAGNTFSQLGPTRTTSNAQICGTFYAANCKGGTVTFTVNFPNSTRFRGIYVAQYSGLSTGAVLNTTSTNNTTGSSTDALASGNANATSAPALVWGFDIDASGNTVPNAGTGFTQRSSAAGSSWTAGNVTCRAEDKRVTVTGNTQATFTNTTGTDVGATFVAIFAEAAGSQYVTPTPRPAVALPGRGPLSKGRFKVATGDAYTVLNTDVTVGITGVQASFSTGNVAAIGPVQNQEESFGLTRNRPGRGPFSKGQFYVGDYTPITNAAQGVVLTGVQASFAAGSVAPATSVPASGTQAAFSAGTVTPGTSIALSGVQTSFMTGTLTPATTVAISGVQATLSAGTLTPNTTVGVTGVQAAFQTGTVSVGGDISLALTGVQASFSTGALTPNLALGITGVQASSSTGSVAPATATTLSGVQATFVTGTVVGSNPLPDTGGGAVMMLFTGFNRKRK